MSKKRDYTAIWGLINATRGVLEAEEAKEIAVSEVSDGRTTSLRELSDRELTRLRVQLRAQARSLAPSKDKTRTRRRSMCLHLMEEYGIDTHDWSRINAFVEDPRIAGKPFGQLTSEELSALSRKLRAIIRKQEEGPFVHRHKGALRLEGDRPRRLVKRRPRYISSGQLTGATAKEINININ